MISSVLGNVVCGFPSPGLENRDEPLDLNEYLIHKPASTFFLRAYGDSMEPLIQRDDILVVDRSLIPHTGDVIIAEIDGCFTAKVLEKRDGSYVLHALNESYEDLSVTSDLVVFGVVTSIVRVLRQV
ncbi:MAG: translesion error-prone DNA polymerase V autoproteolytic subunit [Sphaerochaetaceae bacterium]|jgi:DNA polymerase V|nr:translesion error-prone DNA polymerase V autoproteolytic subunit [Sphaerochaetaceae bacterium]